MRATTLWCARCIDIGGRLRSAYQESAATVEASAGTQRSRPQGQRQGTVSGLERQMLNAGGSFGGAKPKALIDIGGVQWSSSFR